MTYQANAESQAAAQVSSSQVSSSESALVADALEMLGSPETEKIAHLRPGLRRYLEDRIPTGGFLAACLENDLSRAMLHAHPALTLTQMKTLMQLLNNGFPAMAWGSPEKVVAWLKTE